MAANVLVERGTHREGHTETEGEERQREDKNCKNSLVQV